MQPFKLLAEIPCDASVISVAATPNFSAICAATVGKSVYLFDGTGQPVWASPYALDSEAWATAISEDSQFIAVGTANKRPADGTLYVLTRTQYLFWSKRIRAPIWSVSLSADGGTLVAATWGNQLHIFQRQGATYVELACCTVAGSAGLYGAQLSNNGQLCLVASYDTGLILLERSGAVVATAGIDNGLYNVAIARGTNSAYVGTRTGTFIAASIEDEIITRESAQISQRPICGIATSENGLLIALGSFDGRVIMTNNHGVVLWDYQTRGEVWSTAISTNGGLVCAGSGDHKVRIFQKLL